jgi:hypothetical protein
LTPGHRPSSTTSKAASGAQVRIVTTDGELLRELELDADRLYFGTGGRWPVNNILQQASTMS